MKKNEFIRYWNRQLLKIRFKKKEGIMGKISYERRAYESVDDRSLSYAISQNVTGKVFQAVPIMGQRK